MKRTIEEQMLRFRRIRKDLGYYAWVFFMLGMIIMWGSIAFLTPQPIYATGTNPTYTSQSCQYVLVYEPPWQGFGISYSGGWVSEPIDCQASSSGGGTYTYVSGYSQANSHLGLFMILGNSLFVLTIPLLTIYGYSKSKADNLSYELLGWKGEKKKTWFYAIGFFVLALFLVILGTALIDYLIHWIVIHPGSWY